MGRTPLSVLVQVQPELQAASEAGSWPPETPRGDAHTPRTPRSAKSRTSSKSMSSAWPDSDVEGAERSRLEEKVAALEAEKQALEQSLAAFEYWVTSPRNSRYKHCANF